MVFEKLDPATSASQVYGLNLATGTVTQITSDVDGAYLPSYSKSLKKIFFLRNSRLTSVNTDGANLTDIGTCSTNYELYPSLDGTKLTGRRDGANELIIINPDGSGETTVPVPGSFTGAFQLLAGNSSMIFSSNSAGEFDLWKGNVDGSGMVNLTPLAGDYAYQPRVSPDGSEVVFVSKNGIEKINLTTSVRTMLRAITNTETFGWSVDGKWVGSVDRVGTTDTVAFTRADGSGTVKTYISGAISDNLHPNVTF